MGLKKGESRKVDDLGGKTKNGLKRKLSLERSTRSAVNPFVP